MSKNKQGNLGCGFMLLTAFLICSLLFINGLLVKVFLRVNYEAKDPRIIQALQFTLPVLMIFLQFWFYDRLNTHARDVDGS